MKTGDWYNSREGRENSVKKAVGKTRKKKGSMGKKQRRAERKGGVFERALCRRLGDEIVNDPLPWATL